MRIVIDGSGGVTISPDVLQKFPDISVSVNGNTVTVYGVWDKEYVRVISDSIFYSEKVLFESFHILFDDSGAGVAVEISEQLVKYMNSNYPDYTVGAPLSQNDLKKIVFPVGNMIAFDYSEKIIEYVSNNITLDELIDYVADIVHSTITLSPKYQTQIEYDTIRQYVNENLSTVQVESFNTFVSSTISEEEVFNAIMSVSINPSLSILTASPSKYVEFSVSSGDRSIIVAGEISDISTIVQNLQRIEKLSFTIFEKLGKDDANTFLDNGGTVVSMGGVSLSKKTTTYNEWLEFEYADGFGNVDAITDAIVSAYNALTGGSSGVSGGDNGFDIPISINGYFIVSKQYISVGTCYGIIASDISFVDTLVLNGFKNSNIKMLFVDYKVTSVSKSIENIEYIEEPDGLQSDKYPNFKIVPFTSSRFLSDGTLRAVKAKNMYNYHEKFNTYIVYGNRPEDAAMALALGATTIYNGNDLLYDNGVLYDAYFMKDFLRSNIFNGLKEAYIGVHTELTELMPTGTKIYANASWEGALNNSKISINNGIDVSTGVIQAYPQNAYRPFGSITINGVYINNTAYSTLQEWDAGLNAIAESVIAGDPIYISPNIDLREYDRDIISTAVNVARTAAFEHCRWGEQGNSNLESSYVMNMAKDLFIKILKSKRFGLNETITSSNKFIKVSISDGVVSREYITYKNIQITSDDILAVGDTHGNTNLPIVSQKSKIINDIGYLVVLTDSSSLTGMTSFFAYRYVFDLRSMAMYECDGEEYYNSVNIDDIPYCNKAPAYDVVTVPQPTDADHITYTATVNQDGSIDITYVVKDSTGNDVTDQFYTFSVGDNTFIHKENL